MTPRENPDRRVAVIVASVAPGADVARCVSGFAREVQGRGEVLLLDASGDDVPPVPAGVRVQRLPPGPLAPELWRDGLHMTDAPFVAFTTASMVPTPGWLDALRTRLEETGAAGAGGPILPAAGLRASDRAIYLLRYVPYYTLTPADPSPEPAGENAMFRRDRLDGLGGRIDRGFWEGEVHRALRARGDHLATAETAAVTFHGGGRLGPFLRHRLRHALDYGASRGSRMTTAERIARTAAAPLVPALLLKRAVGVLRREGVGLRPWLPAAPGLAVLASAWAAGEAVGTWRAGRVSVR